jgi:hypothetical protein
VQFTNPLLQRRKMASAALYYHQIFAGALDSTTPSVNRARRTDNINAGGKLFLNQCLRYFASLVFGPSHYEDYSEIVGWNFH